ncbi:MAG TPA: YfiR family protein [Opitutaceae bacterium]|jgi:hypothetical protein|nr:YfiR family protein [Opitutaceae bacterium]
MAILKAFTRAWTNHGAKSLGAAALVLLFWAGQEAAAQPVVSREYQVKAVFLFNFAQFVDWPSGTFSSAQAPLVIGVLGDDPFDGFLDETIHDEKVNDHPLIVQRYRRVEEIGACHILFISQSESGRLDRILARLKDRNILTVGDAEDFARRGGMIRFVTENNKIRLRINMDAAKAAELTISSRLLRPAKIVTTGKD